MLRIDSHVILLTLILFSLPEAPRLAHAEPESIIASPTITQTQGNVTINYGNIEIVRKQQVTNGPSLQQIKKAVQTIIEKNVNRSNDELKLLIDQQLNILDSISEDLGQLSSELRATDNRYDVRYQRLLDKLDSIYGLLDQGKTDQARSNLDDMKNITTPGSAFILRTSARTSIGGYSARVFTGGILKTYELAVWPEGIGSSSFALGWGLTFGKGSAHGGYASPEPDHRIVDPSEFTSLQFAVGGIASLLLRRDQRVGISMSLEIQYGGERYFSSSRLSDFDTQIFEFHLRGGIVTYFLGAAFVSVEVDLGLSPWTQYPVFPYNGLGASYADPRSSGGADAGLVMSIGFR